MIKKKITSAFVLKIQTWFLFKASDTNPAIKFRYYKELTNNVFSSYNLTTIFVWHWLKLIFLSPPVPYTEEHQPRGAGPVVERAVHRGRLPHRPRPGPEPGSPLPQPLLQPPVRGLRRHLPVRPEKQRHPQTHQCTFGLVVVFSLIKFAVKSRLFI